MWYVDVYLLKIVDQSLIWKEFYTSHMKDIRKKLVHLGTFYYELFH